MSFLDFRTKPGGKTTPGVKIFTEYNSQGRIR